LFVDVKINDFNLDIQEIKKAYEKYKKKISCVLSVDLFGAPNNNDEIYNFCKLKKIKFLIDGAQSFGSTIDKKSSFKFCDIATTSFFPTKPLGCYGDGGAVFVRDGDLAKKIRAIKSHGGLERFVHKYIGMNSRLDTIQAGVLQVKMKYLDQVLDSRRACAQFYTKELEGIEGLVLPQVPSNSTHVWAQYSILALNKICRDSIVVGLKAGGVNVAIFYPVPLSVQECFSGIDSSGLNFTTSVCDRIFNLPCYGEITLKEQQYIINLIKTLV
jgi:UDP-2-acetamido-2-deoxy-ribo-hexuluronate aminotransferase